MAQERSRHFIEEEIALLVRLVAKHGPVLESKKTDSATNSMKEYVWKQLTEEFNQLTSEEPRDVKALRVKYDNLKKHCRRVFAEEQINASTGGGRGTSSNITRLDYDIKRILDNNALSSEVDTDHTVVIMEDLDDEDEKMTSDMTIKRSKPFVNEECSLLVRLVAKHSSVLESKKTDYTTNRKKEDVWKQLTEEFNRLTSGTPRDAKVLRIKYDNLKKRCRKVFAENQRNASTAGRCGTPSNITQLDYEIKRIIGDHDYAIERMIDDSNTLQFDGSEVDTDRAVVMLMEDLAENETIRMKRGKPFVDEESVLLVRLVEKYRSVLECKKTDASTNKVKLAVWKQLCKEFNQSSRQAPRNWKMLRCKYENLKKACKKKFAEVREGGPGNSGDITQLYYDLKRVIDYQHDDTEFDSTVNLLMENHCESETSDNETYGLSHESVTQDPEFITLPAEDEQFPSTLRNVEVESAASSSKRRELRDPLSSFLKFGPERTSDGIKDVKPAPAKLVVGTTSAQKAQLFRLQKQIYTDQLRMAREEHKLKLEALKLKIKKRKMAIRLMERDLEK